MKIIKGASLLKKGGVVAFPTETVYGLAASMDHLDAINRLFAIKGRSEHKALPVQICDLLQLEGLAIVPEKLRLLLPEFFPGPFTLIFKKHPSVSPLITGGKETIGIRMPENQTALRLLKAYGSPLVVTSANLSGEKELTSAEEIMETFGDQIDGVIEGDLPKYGKPSTVIDLSGSEPVVLRHRSKSSEISSKILKICVSNF